MISSAPQRNLQKEQTIRRSEPAGAGYAGLAPHCADEETEIQSRGELSQAWPPWFVLLPSQPGPEPRSCSTPPPSASCSVRHKAFTQQARRKRVFVAVGDSLHLCAGGGLGDAVSKSVN